MIGCVVDEVATTQRMPFRPRAQYFRGILCVSTERWTRHELPLSGHESLSYADARISDGDGACIPAGPPTLPDRRCCHHDRRDLLDSGYGSFRAMGSPRTPEVLLFVCWLLCGSVDRTGCVHDARSDPDRQGTCASRTVSDAVGWKWFWSGRWNCCQELACDTRSCVQWGSRVDRSMQGPVEFDCSLQKELTMKASLSISIALVSLGVVFIVVGVVTFSNDVLTGSLGGVGGVLMAVGGAISLLKTRKRRARRP
jgi:hypothetical protein